MFNTREDKMNVLSKIAHGQMKEWLLECFEDEYDQEQIRELSYEDCVKAVNRYYDGGFKAFLACMLWEEVEA